MRALMMFSALVLASPPDRPNPTPKDVRQQPGELIVGDWLYVGNGPTPNTQPSPTYIFRITTSETIWIENNQPSQGNGFTAKVAFDWTKSPASIDFMPKRGGNPIRGILRLEGDRFTLAWSNNDMRPADFVAPHNIHHFIRKK
jgi:uncharacterized protein (TIGR03067 family)